MIRDGELLRRQHEAMTYLKGVAADRAKKPVPDENWANHMAVEMLLVVQSMKFEYHAPANVVIRYFCDENGLNFDELEQAAMLMVSDSPLKPRPR